MECRPAIPEIPAFLIPSEEIRQIRPIRGSPFEIQEEENRNHEKHRNSRKPKS